MINKYSLFPSKDDTNYLKAILAILVLLHHIYQEVPLFAGTFLDTIFLALGYLSVAAFFFLSGYGLAFSEKTKGEEYVNGLPTKRIAPFYLQILCLNIIYFLLNGLINNKLDYSGLMYSVFRNDSLIRNGWYLTVSLMTYIVFYYTYKLSKNTILRLLTVAAVLMIFGIACIRIFKFGTWWYESNFAFVIGLLWGTIGGDNSKQSSKNKYYLFLFGTGVVFI